VKILQDYKGTSKNTSAVMQSHPRKEEASITCLWKPIQPHVIEFSFEAKSELVTQEFIDSYGNQSSVLLSQRPGRNLIPNQIGPFHNVPMFYLWSIVIFPSLPLLNLTAISHRQALLQ